MASAGPGTDRLNAAVERLAAVLSGQDVEICVPLYANTFPLATVGRLADELAKKSANATSKIAVNSFDWNWSQDSANLPPFVSSRPLQLFFATASEFARIHAAGISFFAVPASVFHPRYLFVGLPRGEDPTDTKYEHLTARFEEALSTRSASTAPTLLGGKKFALIWVSDIPEQAEMLARRAHSFLQVQSDDLKDELTNFWRKRELGDAMRIFSKPNGKQAPLKAFIWGGPLATVAGRDAEQPVEPKLRRSDSALKLRDPDLANLCVTLPSLTKAFSDDEINARHALYCCIGYKETRRLEDYYTSGKYLRDTPWDLAGLKFKAMRSTVVAKLAGDIREFFAALFVAAHEVPKPQKNGISPVVDDLFQSFVADYDKYCRTLNPIAQLYTREVYAACLRDHHDGEAFATLFP